MVIFEVVLQQVHCANKLAFEGLKFLKGIEVFIPMIRGVTINFTLR